MADDASQVLDPRLYEETLTPSEMALYDSFVNEYLRDFDPYLACLRMGMMAAFATEWSKRFMTIGYVQRAIAFLTRKASENEAAAIESDKALIENTLRQACQHGPYASRVAAAGKLAEMRGLTKPDANADAEQGLIDALKEFAAKAPA